MGKRTKEEKESIEEGGEWKDERTEGSIRWQKRGNAGKT